MIRKRSITMSTEKYQGIFPAFYACYDEKGNISEERTKAFTEYLLKKGVKGVYVCGSSGECIYQSKEERKLTLEAVMSVAKGKMTVIAHVACNNTADSQNWRLTQKAWAWMPLRRFLRSISISRNMRLQHTGTISQRQHRTLIL